MVGAGRACLSIEPLYSGMVLHLQNITSFYFHIYIQMYACVFAANAFFMQISVYSFVH